MIVLYTRRELIANFGLTSLSISISMPSTNFYIFGDARMLHVFRTYSKNTTIPITMTRLQAPAASLLPPPSYGGVYGGTTAAELAAGTVSLTEP